MKRVLFPIIVLAALASSAAVRADPTPAPPTPGVIALGVSVGGVDVGGMTPEAATAAVQEAFDAPLELVVGSTRVLVTPDLLGAAAAVQRAIDRAKTALADTSIPLGVSVDQTMTASFIAKLGKRFDRTPVDSMLTLRGGRPFLTKEKAGRKLDQKRAVRNVGPVIVIHRGLNRLYL